MLRYHTHATEPLELPVCITILGAGDFKRTLLPVKYYSYALYGPSEVHETHSAVAT